MDGFTDLTIHNIYGVFNLKYRDEGYYDMYDKNNKSEYCGRIITDKPADSDAGLKDLAGRVESHMKNLHKMRELHRK